MNRLTKKVLRSVRCLAAALVGALVLSAPAFAQAPNVCERNSNGTLGSVPVTIERARTASYTLNSVFQFAPVPGVRKYTLTIVEYSVSIPGILGRSLSIDLDNLPAHFDETRLNLRIDGTIGVVNHGGGVALTNSAGIAQLDAYYAAITGRAEIRCSDATQGIAISSFRYQPGSPFPGHFGTMRGTVTNIGSTKVTGIDFSFTATPEVAVFEPEVVGLSPTVSPRIAVLAPGEAREFLVPSHLQVDVGGLQHYNITFHMSGTSSNGTVTATANATSGLNLTFYYITIYEKVRAFLFEAAATPFRGLVDKYAGSSTIGGLRVGATESTVKALKEMADGTLDVATLVKDAVVDPETRKLLTDKAEKMKRAMLHYHATHTKKQMAADLGKAGVKVTKAGAGAAWDWLGRLNDASAKGDAREVGRMLGKTGTELIGAELAAEAAIGKLFGKLLADKVPPKLLKARKRAPDAPDEFAPDVDFKRHVLDEVEDLRDLPTGVPLPGSVVARAGLSADEHAAMIDIAKHYDVGFFVRPRPKEAIEWAYRGYTAKPMSIKLKSVTDIDVDYLGYDGFADKKGLVVLREPVNPQAKIRANIRAGKLKLDDPKIKEIVERYNARKAEWDKSGGDDYIRAQNAENGGKGIKIFRHGKEVYTKIKRNPDGLITTDYNLDKPIYSDIDLLHIAQPNGKQLDADKHAEISKLMKLHLDPQHGDTFASADFLDGEQAAKFASQYGREHMRGGEPLIIVTADATTAGYVKDFAMPADWGTGSGAAHFGKIDASYEGNVFQ